MPLSKCRDCFTHHIKMHYPLKLACRPNLDKPEKMESRKSGLKKMIFADIFSCEKTEATQHLVYFMACSIFCPESRDKRQILKY